DLLDRLRQRRPRTSNGRPFLEIQYHSSDIKRGVRYLFLTRRQVIGAVVGLVVYVVFVAFSIRIGPEVVRDAWAREQYAAEQIERTEQGERLGGLVERFEALENEVADVRVQMAKIHLAYGFPNSDAKGQGGYPLSSETTPVPESIYAGKIRRGNGLERSISGDFAALETLLGEVDAFEVDHEDQVRFTPSLSPVRSQDFVLTSPFGMRTSPFTKEADFHAGIDLAAKTGTPILAPADGLVAFAGRYPLRQSVGWWRYGNLVALRHGDRYITLYGHCDEVKVRGGQKVKRGDVIATVGDTGWSTSPHLHYEVRRLVEGDERLSQPIDPRIYILDHEWRDAERILVRARHAPQAADFEPLPKTLRR
ncbi:MAG: M23 family metallopeptidase, partial [Acidobacteriota bacterium]